MEVGLHVTVLMPVSYPPSVSDYHYWKKALNYIVLHDVRILCNTWAQADTDPVSEYLLNIDSKYYS